MMDRIGLDETKRNGVALVACLLTPPAAAGGAHSGGEAQRAFVFLFTKIIFAVAYQVMLEFYFKARNRDEDQVQVGILSLSNENKDPALERAYVASDVRTWPRNSSARSAPLPPMPSASVASPIVPRNPLLRVRLPPLSTPPKTKMKTKTKMLRFLSQGLRPRASGTRSSQKKLRCRTLALRRSR